MTDFSPAHSAARTATDHESSATEPSATEPSATEPSATEPSAKEKAADVAQSGKQAVGDVAQTATDAAKDVAEQTKQQAGDLIGETKSQVAEQAANQQSALVESLRSLGDQLAAMTDNVDQDGTAVELAGKAGERARSAADWLDEREPGDVLEEVRRLGRDRPAAFLLGAALAGVVAGRLTRGVVAVHVDDHSSDDNAADTPDAADVILSSDAEAGSAHGTPAFRPINANPGAARHQSDPVADTPAFGVPLGVDPAPSMPPGQQGPPGVQGPRSGGMTQP